jgi:hypothetical protein
VIRRVRRGAIVVIGRRVAVSDRRRRECDNDVRESVVVKNLTELGPVGYLIVEFPGNKMTGEGLPALVDLVDRGLIRVIDLAFVMKDTDGSVRALELKDFDGNGQLAIFEGASSGILDDSDIESGGSAISPGSSAAMLIYENRWALPFVSALRRGGAELVAAGFIPQDDIVAALDMLDAAN